MAKSGLTREGPNFINESVIDEHIDKWLQKKGPGYNTQISSEVT